MEGLRVSVDEGYSRWADTYDAYPNGLVVLEEPLVRALLEDIHGKRVLDVGCGTGRHAEWLARAGARVVGVDPNEAMTAIARRKCAGLAEELVLEHVPDLHGAMVELARVLAPGGALVVSVYHPFFLLKGVPPHFEHDADSVEYELPAHVHLPSDYVGAVRLAGLALEHMAEPLVDDAVVAQVPRMAKHRGHPRAIILKATKA